MFLLMQENMQTSSSYHMAGQVSTVLCKAMSRRSELCRGIGGAGTLPFGLTTPSLYLDFHF